MAEDLQYLMERIQKDAVDKAETEAAAIIARAKDKAGRLKPKRAPSSKRPTRTPKRLRNAANALWNSLPVTSCFR